MCTDNGLARLDVSRAGNDSGSAPRIQTFQTATGLMSDNVHTACEDSSGALWVGADGPRVAVQSNGRFTSRPLKGIPATASVRALLCAGDTVWAGTSDGLIRIRSADRGDDQRLFTLKDGLADDFVFSLAQGSSGTIWIGTRNGFSRLRDGSLDSFHPQDGLSQSTAIAMFEDREGTLWVGTKRGLNQFVDGRGVPYTVSEGLPSNEAGPVLEDHAGVIWAGTLDRGLARFDGQDFRALNTRDGLASNTVLSLAVDRDGSLWAGTQNGLNQLRGGRVVETYRVQQGLPGNLDPDLVRGSCGCAVGGDRKTGWRYSAADALRPLPERRREPWWRCRKIAKDTS